MKNIISHIPMAKLQVVHDISHLLVRFKEAVKHCPVCMERDKSVCMKIAEEILKLEEELCK